MNRTRVVSLIVMALSAIVINGCAKATYIPKPFPVNGSTYFVHEDALDTMREFVKAQESAARVNGRPVSEWERMGLYGKAANKKNKITPGRARKALKKYRKTQEILAASLPPIVPDARGYSDDPYRR